MLWSLRRGGKRLAFSSQIRNQKRLVTGMGDYECLVGSKRKTHRGRNGQLLRGVQILRSHTFSLVGAQTIPFGSREVG